MAKSKRSRRTQLRLFYLFFIPGVVFSSFYIQQDTHAQLAALEVKKEKALEKKQQLEMERDYLKHKIELLSNSDYFKSHAKRKLLYTSEGEILFVFPDEH